ncbi:glycosyltransferase, partial [Candidatus Gottesmanbacteria bacterium]|nr:glycosyltransferase [Candidatus Gottesmanbacteria bacterium]
MKILMLTPYLPYPLYSGGQIRSYNLLKYLSKKHQITLFSFIRSESETKYVKKLKEFCTDVRVFVKRPPWSLTSLALSAISVYPLVVCMYLKRNLKEEIGKAIEREHFDLIHAETFYVMPNIPENKIPTILVEQTIEYLVYQHFTESIKLLPLKWIMNFDVLKIRFWEKKFWQTASRVVAMSAADKKIMQTLTPRLTVDLVPNGVDTEFFT